MTMTMIHDKNYDAGYVAESEHGDYYNINEDNDVDEESACKAGFSDEVEFLLFLWRDVA